MQHFAKKLAHLQHEEWVARQAIVTVTDAAIAKALQILDRPTKRGPEAGDELPKGYVSTRRKHPRNSRRAG